MSDAENIPTAQPTPTGEIPFRVVKLGNEERPATPEDIKAVIDALEQVANMPHQSDVEDPALLKVKGNSGRRKLQDGVFPAGKAILNEVAKHGVLFKSANWLYDILNQLIDDRPTDAEREDEKRSVKELSGAVFRVVQKYGYANLRVVGAAALNRATKAIINAQSDLLKHGVKVATEFSYTDVEIGGRKLTGYTLHVRVQ